MNKIAFAFIKSHIKTAIFELEVANRLKPNCIDTQIIENIKLALMDLIVEHEQEEGSEE